MEMKILVGIKFARFLLVDKRVIRAQDMLFLSCMEHKRSICLIVMKGKRTPNQSLFAMKWRWLRPVSWLGRHWTWQQMPWKAEEHCQDGYLGHLLLKNDNLYTECCSWARGLTKKSSLPKTGRNIPSRFRLFFLHMWPSAFVVLGDSSSQFSQCFWCLVMVVELFNITANLDAFFRIY